MTEIPKPSWLLIAISILVIVSSLLIVSLAISAFAVTWDLCAMAGGVFLLPTPAALAVQQYRGTFCRVRSAASTASLLLFIVGVFASFAFVFTFIEIVMAGGRLRQYGFLLPILIIVAVGLLGGWLNLEWRRRLAHYVSDSGYKFSLREALVAFIAVCLTTAWTSSLIRHTPPQYAEGVPASEAPFSLPDGATDISYCQGGRGMIAYEFTVDEAAFRRWVAKGIGSIKSDASGTKLKKIVAPEYITRYNYLSEDLDGPKSITVKNGLYYSWSFEDQGVYAVFDSNTNRGYYFQHFH